ncbi:hypothetical protein EDC96DRAFT_505629 [Choanephora cucurbitarum]|nr:hypothetical protein EDC96DRAFT_505629 [Choanephora cucurbitarum]
MANNWLKPNKKPVYRDITIPLDKSELRTKRNDLSSLEERYQWATYWKDHSTMNYTTNCLFLGHTRFYSMDKQKSVFAMCAFTIHGVLKADIMESMSDGEDQIRFERFVQQVAYSMDQDDRLNKYYVVTQHDSIASQVYHRGYSCICLPHFSPDLDPMEQYWSACQNRLIQLVTQCAFISTMLDVFYRMRLIDLQCFCQYSMSLMHHCTNKLPI